MQVAFALGWHVAELYRRRAAPIHRATDAAPESNAGAADPHEADPDSAAQAATGGAEPAAGPAEGAHARGPNLPGISRLTAAELDTLHLDEIRVDVAALSRRIVHAGLRVPHLPHSSDLAGRHADARYDRCRELHVSLLSILTATDFRLGKAYGLGRALADTSREAHDAATLAEQLGGGRIANLRSWVGDLTSALPAHAGHAVDRSLDYWEQWAQAAPAEKLDGDPLRTALLALRRQGELWRSLLTGEKQGTDLLELDDYVAAAGNAMRRASAVCGRFLLRFWWVVLVVVVLAAGGVTLILVADRTTNILAGAGALIASAGITWRTTSATLGSVFTKIEGPVWGAELDQAIVYALTLPPARDQIAREAPGPIAQRAVRRRARRARTRTGPPPTTGTEGSVQAP